MQDKRFDKGKMKKEIKDWLDMAEYDLNTARQMLKQSVIFTLFL